jgi:hypothetical protein
MSYTTEQDHRSHSGTAPRTARLSRASQVWAGLARKAVVGGVALTVAVGLTVTGGSAVAAQPAVTARLNNYTLIGVGDWDRDGYQDIVARNPFTKNLVLYPGDGQLGFSSQPPVVLSDQDWTGWEFGGLADMNRDGRLDILARNTQGKLYSVAGTGQRATGLLSSTDIGASGWNDYTIAGVTNWDRDPGNYPDIVARGPENTVWVYQGDSSGTYDASRRYPISGAWNGYTFAGVTDWNTDGQPDIIAKDGNGALFRYYGPKPSPDTRRQIGYGWQSYTFAGVADWNNDHSVNIIARDDAGNLWVYSLNPQGNFDANHRAQIGSGW